MLNTGPFGYETEDSAAPSKPDGSKVTLLGDSTSTELYSGGEISTKLPGIQNISSNSRGFGYAGADIGDTRTGMEVIAGEALRRYVVLALDTLGAARH